MCQVYTHGRQLVRPFRSPGLSMMNCSPDFANRLAAIIPSSCALCGTGCSGGICSACDARYLQRHANRCLQCGVAISSATTPAQRCGECLRHSPKFDATIVATDYLAPVDQLVQALKFGNRLALAPLFGRMLFDAIRRTPTSSLPTSSLPTLITAVPLSSVRLQNRGFNQALEIAKPLAKALSIPLAPTLLARLRDTKMQALLHPDERHKNMRNAFTLSSAKTSSLSGQHVAVVDDVMTTGETLNEVAITLKRNGASYVTNFVVARTPPKH